MKKKQLKKLKEDGESCSIFALLSSSFRSAPCVEGKVEADHFFE